MNFLNKLDEIVAFADFLKNNVIVLRNEIEKQEESKKRVDNKSLDLIARVKAKRAINRFQKH
jgi:hypothetical protein